MALRMLKTPRSGRRICYRGWKNILESINVDKEQVANNILHANGTNEQPILGDHNNGNFP